MIEYDESEVVAFAKDCDALLKPDSGRVGVNCARMQWDACNGMGYSASRAKHLRELQLELGVAPPFPPAPTRDELLKGQITAQGLIVHTTKYGDMPWWPGAWAWLDTPTRREVGAQLLEHGDAICAMALPCGPPIYDEPPPNFYTADKFGPLDLTNPIAQFVAVVEETLLLGFKGVWIILGGDGSYDLAVAQVRALAPALAASPYANLNEYSVVIPGWDGPF